MLFGTITVLFGTTVIWFYVRLFVPVLLEQPIYLREHFHAPLEYPFHVRDGNSIICHGYVLVLRAFKAVVHLPLVEHTAATVEDHFVCAQVIGELCPGSRLDIHVFP